MADYNIVQEAVRRGYSMDEIADKLATDAGYDPALLHERGYDSNEILLKLGYSTPKPVANPAQKKGFKLLSDYGIAEARSAGYSDDQILGALSSSPDFAHLKVSDAVQAGYSPKQILDALEQKKQISQPENTGTSVAPVSRSVLPPLPQPDNSHTVAWGAGVTVFVVVALLAWFKLRKQKQLRGVLSPAQPPMSDLASEKIMSSNARPPYEWSSVVVWILSLFLLGLTTAHHSRGSDIDRFALGLLSGIAWAVVGGLVVATVKYFKRSSKLDLNAELASAKSIDHVIYFGAFTLAAFYIGVAIYLGKYDKLLDGVALVALGFGVRKGLGFTRWILAVYAFISAMTAVHSGGSGLIWAFVFYATCRSIIDHRAVDVAREMGNKQIPSSALNTTSQNSQAQSASGLIPKIIMGAVVAIVLFFGLYQSMQPSDYSSCILKELPGTENDVVANTKANQCKQQFDDQGAIVPTSTSESQDCLIKYASSTSNKRTVFIIRRACLLKYGTSTVFDPDAYLAANPAATQSQSQNAENFWEEDPVVGETTTKGQSQNTLSAQPRKMSDEEVFGASARQPQLASKPSLNSEGWTQESTGSAEVGPWLNYSPHGTRYYRDANRTIYRVYPPGVKPSAEKANPFGLDDSTEYVPQ